jgi:tetratricopeptide (TPR) repeat protein
MQRLTGTCIFISSGPADRAFGHLLAQSLRDAGADVWLPELGAPAAEIRRAIRRYPVFLVVLSPVAFADPDVQEACAVAYSLEGSEAHHVILPVMAPGYGPYRASEAIARVQRKLGRLFHTKPEAATESDGEAAPLIARAQSLSVRLFSPEALNEARLLFERATQLAPSDVTAWTGLGDMCALLQRDAEALAAFERALALVPESADIWCDAGAMRSRLRDYAGSLAAYERALALDPDSPRALEQRGRMLVALNRIEEAIAAYDAALARHPDAAALWHARGNALQALGRDGEALDAYDRALALWPHFTCVWRDKAAALRTLGRHAEAFDAERHAAGWVS